MTTAFCFILALMINFTASARILGIFMIDSYSHFNINNAIMETLAMAGHEVTVISSLKPRNPLENITYIQARNETSNHISIWSEIDLKLLSWWQLFQIFQDVGEKDCDQFMALEEAQDLLVTESKPFDLLFIELLHGWECYMLIAWRLNIPIIGTSSLDIRLISTALLGNPFYPSIIPHPYTTFTSRMTFIERLKNTIETIYIQYLIKIIVPDIEQVFQKYYPKGNLKMADISLLFLNNHPTLFPLPYVPGIIQTGGIHLKPPQPLPKHLEEFIRGAEHGVILFSLGTVATTKDLSTKARQIFRNVFAKIPQRVIWKFGEQIDGISDNVLISEWIPQQDILAQENVVLFISHGGKSSTIEAIHTGTPVLVVPLFADQFSNAGNVKDLGVGKIIDIFNLNEASVLRSIQELLDDKSYKDRAKKLSQAFNDFSISPKKAVLYWTEYVLKYTGANHLRTSAADMPFYNYLLFDVILIMVTTVFPILIFILYVMKTVYSFMRFTSKNIKKNLNKKKNISLSIFTRKAGFLTSIHQNHQTL